MAEADNIAGGRCTRERLTIPPVGECVDDWHYVACVTPRAEHNQNEETHVGRRTTPRVAGQAATETEETVRSQESEEKKANPFSFDFVPDFRIEGTCGSIRLKQSARDFGIF
jgi:hypothetical protein